MDRRARRRILKPGRVGLTALIGCLGLLASCSGQRLLDGSQLEAELNEQLLPQYPGAIRSISCPDKEDPAPGQELLCIATIGDQVLDVNVTIGGVEGELTTSASIDARFVAVNEIAALLSATFGDEIGIVTSVDCGVPVVVLEEDDTVTCDATDPRGVTRVFDVAIDNAGLLTISLR